MKKLLILVALIFFGTISYAGCNDPLACNYVSTDSDSQDCLLWTLSVGGGTSLSEMSWELYNSNNQLIASGMAPEVVCLPANDDCYELRMFDEFGDGWAGGSISIVDELGEVLINATITNDGLHEGEFEIAHFNVGDVPCVTQGCTDHSACNYDSAANEEDGSCVFDNCSGCKDPEAINYCSNCWAEDGSCIFNNCELPLTYEYCYGSYENRTWQWDAASQDERATLYFVEGMIEESTYDNLTIYTGISSNWDVQYSSSIHGESDLAGLLFQSDPGESIYMTLSTDGSVSCESSQNLDPWVWEVYCAQAIIPGCTAATACNFDPLTNLDDGSCEYSTCIDCVGDTNFDGVTNINDLVILVSNFGCTEHCEGDTDGDFDVDIYDLINLSNYFGMSCED